MLYYIFQDTRAKWQIVFYISAAIYVTGCILFNVFARGEEQEWNIPEVSVLVYKGNKINERDRSESSQNSISSRIQSAQWYQILTRASPFLELSTVIWSTNDKHDHH